MAFDHLLKLVARNSDFPRIAKHVSPRKPELLALKKPKET